MKIAVTYENGQIFQHFGHSESFKVYEAEGKNIVRAEVISTDGAGHSALAAVLKDKGVDVLICGGIGNGAVTALSEAGIDVYSGADGEADAAVEAYLNGDLTSAGINCDHHHDHEEHEHHHEHDENCTCGCHDHDHEHHHHHHADEVFTSWGKETPHKFTKEKIEDVLKTLCETDDYGTILRAKGMVEDENGTWIYFDMVPGEYELRDGEPDYTGRIVVIGTDIHEHELEELFGLA